jgi:hypothetical protein
MPKQPKEKKTYLGEFLVPGIRGGEEACDGSGALPFLKFKCEILKFNNF